MNQVIPAIEQAVINESVTLLMARLIALSSFFAFPVINPLVILIVTKIITFLVQETALGLSLLWITLNVSYDLSSLDSATTALKAMINDPKGYSNAQSSQIEANFDQAARNLIKLSIAKL